MKKVYIKKPAKKYIKKPAKKYDSFELQLHKLHQCSHAEYDQSTPDWNE